MKDFWAIVWIGLSLGTIPLLVVEHTLGPVTELPAVTGEVREAIESEDTEAVTKLILGLPFDYMLTEKGKQLLVESGLWERMLGIVEDLGSERTISGYGPEWQLSDYVVLIAPEAVYFAHENDISSELILGTVAIGFQEIYAEMYGGAVGVDFQMTALEIGLSLLTSYFFKSENFLVDFYV